MNSLFSILLKNSILLALITISLIFVLTQHIGYKEIRFIFASVGILYVLSACYEAYALSIVKQGTRKFIYFTDGFIAKRIIKIISFTCIGILMYTSGSIIKYMSFICFLIAFTEVVLTFWRKLKHLSFVAFESDLIIVSTNKIDTISVKEIQKIETRHGLTYFVKYNKNTITLRTDMMSEADEFKVALSNWITHYNLNDKVVVG